MTLRRPSRTAVARLVAGALLATGTTLAGPAGAVDTAVTEPAVVDVADDEFGFAWDEGSGCGISEDVWELCVYYQHGLESFARVVPDASLATGGDGALRIATPNADDQVLLEYFTHDDGREFPRFADLASGSVSMRVVSGEAPVLSLKLGCAPEEPYGGDISGLGYAGVYPDPGAGWVTIDLVQGGEAPWSNGSGVVRPLREWQSECADGVIRGHNLFQRVAGSDARVDILTLGHRSVNFWVRPLTRVEGRYGSMRLQDKAGERLLARKLSQRQFVTDAWYRGYADDDWADPARERLPSARAGVVAPQGSFPSALVAGPLANAVRGPLFVNPVGQLEPDVEWGLRQAVGADRTVYLVGNGKQLSRKVARQIRAFGYRVVRLAGRSDYATAVKVAEVIDRRRRNGARATYVLASAERAKHSLPASAAAGTTKGAVLLTRASRLPAVTRRYLRSHRPADVYAVGRAAALAVPALSRSHKLYGATPWATSVEVAERFFAESRGVVVTGDAATEEALLAGAHGGLTGQPLLLVNRDFVPRVVRQHLVERNNGLRGSLLAGGAPAVSEDVFDHLFELLRRS